VVDESSLRRGRATANAMFGNAASVLVGDFLYSRAFQMMVSVNRMRVLEVLADATNVIAEGEVLQLMNMHDPDLSVEDYLQVIRFKTAKLFEASASLGAVLAGADERIEEACAELRPRAGHRLPAGGRPARLRRQHRRTGQERRRRPARGQADLAAAGGDGTRQPTERALIRHAIEQGEVQKLPEILAIVRRTGALDATREAAQQEADKARDTLSAARVGAREALLELCARSVHRSS
jgi:octaprenyl-diphosphate synthase